MSKLRSDARVVLAGMCYGLFSVSVFLLAARVDSYYDYLNWLERNSYATTWDRGVEDLWWVPIALWHVVLSIIASLLIQRYLANERVSAFLRWQAIGVAALFGWGISIFIGVGAECLIRGETSFIAQAQRSVRWSLIAQFIATVFASNVLYGSAIQAASAEAIHAESQRDAGEA